MSNWDIGRYLRPPVRDVSALKNLGVSPFISGTVVVVLGTRRLYVYDRSGADAESLPDVVAPVSGTGRWYIATEASVSGAVARAWRDVSTDYAMVEEDTIIRATGTNEVTLYDLASDLTEVTIYNVSGTTTILPGSGQTIPVLPDPLQLTVEGESITLTYDASSSAWLCL